MAAAGGEGPNERRPRSTTSNNAAVTLGEVSRRVDDLKSTVSDGFDRLEKRMDGLNVVYADTYASDQRRLEDRHSELAKQLAAIAEGLSKVRMALFGALLSGVVGVVLYLVAHAH